MFPSQAAATRHATRRMRASTCALLAAFAGSVSMAAEPVKVATAPSPRQSADGLLIVDCLLPAQVRQLGTSLTYLAPRRPIKTSASDCAIRGGEYAANDRANLATAMQVWLPQAERGEKVAQTNVGEIYEKGVGAAPDYVNAAKWYRKAADQGYARALTNLGFLYEQGLGVAKDPVLALNLYRKAAGIEGAVNLDGAVSGASTEDVDTLRRELERTRQDLEKARRTLDEERLKSGREFERLLEQKGQAVAAGNTAETRRLEGLLKERETELERRRQQVAQAEHAAESFRSKLKALEEERGTLQQELDRARRQLAETQAQIEKRKSDAAAAERQIEAMRAELARQKQSASQVDAAQLKSAEAALARQRDDIARLEGEIGGYKGRIATLELRPGTAGSPAVVAPPTIQIIDPPVVVTRDSASIKVRSGVRSRDVVGRVSSPAGLMSFTANDVAQSVDDNGMFKATVDLSAGQARVTMVAVDRQGKSARLEFMLEQDANAGPQAALAKPRIPRFNAGNYHALLIGNQRYDKLPRLETPETDVTDLAPILRDRYGFKTTVLLNATRYQILTELNKLRDTLTERDNLLIYYAGHGELDRANGLANWLPIDAEPSSNANWISSSSLTEIMNAMAAKHVLVVADSCYSGALTRSSIGQLQSGLTDEAREEWLKQIAAARSRTALTSGGIKPVLDGFGGKYSIFASIFIDILSQNQDVLEGMRLYREVSARVLNIAARHRFEQRPEYGAIRFAGGDSGDFLFVPRT